MLFESQSSKENSNTLLPSTQEKSIKMEAFVPEQDP